MSAEEDFLYVLFATTQETHLKFILNGPYRTNPARETISEDDPFNEYLLKETCDLVKEVLPQIRQRGLLTTEFLAVLPNRNDDDRLKDFYEPIMDRLVEAFKNEQLIPMKQGGHAPATDVFRGSAQLSDLIDDKDLARILGDGHSSPLWIKNPQSHSREGHFLSMLEIKKWTTQDLIDELSEESEMIMKWLARKNYDWHRRLYVLLLDELNGLNKSLERTYWYEDGVKQKRKDKLLNLCIIRCSDKKYRKGKDCFFPSDGLKNDEEFPLVAKRLYSSGKDENQRNRVLEFLKEMEVKDVEESDRIEAILKQRYSKGSIVSNPQDIKNFIAFAEKEPDKADMFKNYYIFELERQDGRWWGKPKIVFLDSPYLDTGLRAYYEALDDDTGRKWALSPKYKESGIEEKKIGEFAKKVGAQTELEVKEQKIPYRHPKRDYLFSAPGERRRNEIDLDYTIPAFRVLLDKPNVDKARLQGNRIIS